MIQQQPTERIKEYQLIRSFRPSGSSTVIWAENLTTHEMYYLLQWGNMVYLPVETGDHIAIGIYNDTAHWKAYPAFVEALNIWEDGQSEPENCDTNHMWEVQPYGRHIIDALMNPHAQIGRPLIITRSGEGMAIGESTFGTTAYRGQIRVYERNQVQRTLRPYMPSYGAHPTLLRHTHDDSPFGHMEQHAVAHSASDAGLEATAGRSGSTHEDKAAIGAGEEEYRSHQQTGVEYTRHAQQLVAFQVEFRSALQPMLNRAWGKQWNWFWPQPREPRWFDEPWTWSSPRCKTSPQVPVIQPHTGQRVRS